MKLTKYTFRTPLFGSISCEEALSDTDGRIELSPEMMCGMYNKGPALQCFLSENAEDLASCVPEDMTDVVFRAEFGDCAMFSHKMWLRTYVWVDGDLTESGIQAIQEWITGQMSDGWGEGLEQREWQSERIRRPFLCFDESSLEFEEDYEYCRVYYHVHPWNSDDFEIYLEDCEDVEEEVELKVVATMALPSHNRQVVKLPTPFAVRMFLKDFGRPDLIAEIDDCCPLPNYSAYLVRDFDGESGMEILPKWALEHDASCAVYDMADDVEVRGTQMPVSKAILELLK